MLAAGFIIGAPGVGGQSSPKEPPPPPPERIVDADGDKVFDDLEQSLAPAVAGQPFDVIVLLNQPLSAAKLNLLRQRVGPFDTRFEYPSIDGFAATLNKGQITALAKLDLVAQIEPDRIVKPTLDNATLWFGVQAARTDFGVDGNADAAATYSSGDIVIAIVDTGIDDGHVDLNDGKVIAWKDFINDDPDPYDENGCSYHGTHVSSIAAGEGQGDSAFTGVAPGAALVGVKVLGVQRAPGGPPRCLGFTSQVNGGIQWVIDNKATYNIRVFNMSLGVDGCFDGTDSQSMLVNAAVAAGLVAVVSAGNEGPAACTIGSPAAAQDAITVAAMADPGHGGGVTFSSCGDAPAGGFYLVCFSSRGPTADDRIKPDIASAGVLIRAAEGGTSSSYKDLSGTSMASPFTAGTVALMLDADPSLTPAQVKAIIMDTAVDWGTSGKDTDYGAGRLDAFEAVSTAANTAGTNISVPNHHLIWGQLDSPSSGSPDNCSSPGSFDDYTVDITDSALSLAVTLIMPAWNPDGSNELDFELCLFDKDGVVLDSSTSASRQETVGVAAASNGPYKVRVYAWPGNQSFSPSIGGPYFFDISVGGSVTEPVSISLTTDGTTPFGVQDFNVTVDTTASGTNDVQTVQVSAGPADLFIRTTLFANNGNVWSLGSSNGADQVVWEFSTDGTNWTAFTEADALSSLASSVPSSGTLDVYLRLTMPTEITSSEEHSATVTIVATSP
jgi:serine protease AprX